MTDTDLFTAGESTDSDQLSDPVTTDTRQTSKTDAARCGSLSTMVLPELRALANQVGVKGTSGYAQERTDRRDPGDQGQANGTRSRRPPPSTADERHSDEPSHAEAPDPHQPAPKDQNDSATEAPAPGTTRRLPRRRDRPATPPRRDRDGDPARAQARRTGNGEPDRQDTQDRRARTAGRPGGDQQGSGGQQATSRRLEPADDDDGEGRQGRRGRRFRDRRRRGERPGEAAAATPNCARTTSSSRSPASSTSWTTTRSCAPPATWPVRTTSTCR